MVASVDSVFVCRPDAYFLVLPEPGQRLATGTFSEEELKLFERRICEFQANRWPLQCWVR